MKCPNNCKGIFTKYLHKKDAVFMSLVDGRHTYYCPKCGAEMEYK